MTYQNLRFAVLTPGEAARELSISPRTLERYVLSGRIVPSHRTPGGQARFARSTIDAMLAPPPMPVPNTKSLEETLRLLEALRAAQYRAALAAGRVKRWQAARDQRAQEQAAFVAHCRRHLADRFGLTRRQIYDLVWSEAVERVAARFGISGTALRKTCRRYQIPVPTAGYWRNLEAKKPTKAFIRPPLGSLKAPNRTQPKWRPREHGQ